MAGTRRTITDEPIPDAPVADPNVAGLVEFVERGAELPDTIGELEFSVRAQRKGKDGRPIHGRDLKTTNLPGLFEEILEGPGPGIYDLYVNFRPTGSAEKYRFKKFSSVLVEDAEAAVDQVPLAGAEPGGAPATFVQMMLQQNQQMFSMMMQQQKSQTEVLVAVLSGRNSPPVPSPTDAILKAVELGRDLSGGGDGDGGGGSPLERLIDFGLEAFRMLKDQPPEGGAVPADQLRAAATKHGVNQALLDQGIEELS